MDNVQDRFDLVPHNEKDNIQRVFYIDAPPPDGFDRFPEREIAYKKNPQDAENLTRWAEELFELANLGSHNTPVKYLEDAVSKLQEALKVNPKKRDALYCLGNVYTSLFFCFMDTDTSLAKVHFHKATDYFQRALDEDPSNTVYMDSLYWASKGPDWYLENRNQIIASRSPPAAASPASGSKASEKRKEKKQNSYLKYGCVVLAVAVIAWVGSATLRMPSLRPGHMSA